MEGRTGVSLFGPTDFGNVKVLNQLVQVFVEGLKQGSLEAKKPQVKTYDVITWLNIPRSHARCTRARNVLFSLCWEKSPNSNNVSAPALQFS